MIIFANFYMFELEFIGLLNEWKKAQDDYSKNKVKSSIENLILENKNEYVKFLQTQSLDLQTQELLKECENSIENKKDEENAKEQNDFELIKNYYLRWLQFYQNNNNLPESNCEAIIEKLIYTYTGSRFEVLKKVLEIKDDENFENFKGMLKNYIRKYFAQKILAYYESDNYKNLGFFEKRKKKNEILNILDDIGKYEFNYNQIMEVVR